MAKNLEKFIAEWRFDRALTLDLLRSLSSEDLRWSPGANVGELWKQFRHLGRVQENYMEALDTGTVKFEPAGTYTGTANGDALVGYLQALDEQLQCRLSTIDENKMIDWFGETISVIDHLLRMMSHETLHHGQLIVYLKLLDKKFPSSWEIWGLD